MDTIRRLSSEFRDGSNSPAVVLADCLARIREANSKFNCFITVLEEQATTAAAASSARMKEGRPIGPLDGIPVAIKDIVYIEGVRCTAGSKILGTHVASYDAPSVRRLKAAGAVIVGTTNLHEFAAGVTSDNPHYGPVRNPWNEELVAGGSSGGSAAAVALGMATCAIGTDTAGSVRIPASLCGVVGLKPSFGRVSRLGVIPLAPSFDTVGTLTGSSWDAAAMLGVLAGRDGDDLTASDSSPPDYLRDLEKNAQRLTIGVPKKYFQEGVDQDVLKSFSKSVDQLSEIGVAVKEVEFDVIEEISKAFYPIRRAEATAFHLPWLQSVPQLYGTDVLKLLEVGKSVTAVDYVRAQNARPGLIKSFLSAMDGLDAIATPCTSVTAPLIGQTSLARSDRQLDVYSALNRLTLPFNVLGLPALALPTDQAGGLPVGTQLVSRPFDESTLLRIGNSYEEETGPHPSPPFPWAGGPPATH